MTGLQGPRLCAQVSLVSATLLVTLDRDNSIRLYPLLIPASLRRRLVIESSRTVQDHRLLAAESGSTLNTPAYLPLPPRLYIHTYVRVGLVADIKASGVSGPVLITFDYERRNRKSASEITCHRGCRGGRTRMDGRRPR